jgi:hypothetical protein
MRNRLFCATLIALACLAFLKPIAGEERDAAGQTEMPEWAAILPAEPALVFVIADVERFCDIVFPPDPSKKNTLPLESLAALVSEHDPKSAAPLRTVTEILKTLLKGLKGACCLAVDEEPKWPTIYIVGNLKPEAADFGAFLSRELQPLLDRLGKKSLLEKGQDVSRFQVGDVVFHFSTVESRILASTDRAALLRMRDPNLSPESVLARNKAFHKAISHVSPEGFFAFVDGQRLLRLHFGQPSTGTLKALSDMGFDRLESVAFSAHVDESSLKLKFAMTNDGEVTGIPGIVLRPNTASQAARFVPADYSVFARLSVAGAIQAYHKWQGIVRKMVDDVSWKEYQDALAERNKKRGFALEDVLENLGDEVAVAVKLPEMIGIPPTLVFVSVKDEEKALDMISRFLTKARANPQVFKTADGATIYTTTLVRGVFLSYTTKDGYLIVGLSPTSVASALVASESGESLAELKAFKSAVEAAPEENLLFAYADMGPVARFVAGLVHWFESGLHAMLRSIFLDVESSQETAEIVQRLNLESERMGKAVFSATGGDDYLLVQAEIPMAVIRTLASLLTEPFAAAREKARRTACMNNLQQIMVACYQYASEHDGRFPDKLSQLEPYVKSLQVFSCPETGTVISRPEDIDSMSSYKFLGGFVLKDVKRTGEKVVLYEAPGSHGEWTNVGFADGYVKSYNAEGFRNLMKEAGVQIESK